MNKSQLLATVLLALAAQPSDSWAIQGPSASVSVPISGDWEGEAETDRWPLFLLLQLKVLPGKPNGQLMVLGQKPEIDRVEQWGETLPATMRPLSAQVSTEAKEIEPRAVVSEVRRIISERYVLPERRGALDSVLKEGLASGRYDVADPGVLAERINEDLERLGRDRHLYFRFDPARAAALGARDDEQAPDPSAFQRQVRSANHGITELRLLPGNVRYVAYDQWMWIGPESAAAIDNAVRFLSGGDAIIIDIRRNGGGDSEASDYLISHFLPPRKFLYTYHEAGKAKRVYAAAEVPTTRLLEKPLYVLTSDRTGSASEAFAGHVRGYQLGEVVGTTTAGAGFMNDLIPLGGRFLLSLSIMRVALAPTGRDWEGVGILPTIRTAAPQALDAAHVHALRRLAPEAPPRERPRLRALAEGIEARLEPRDSALPLSAYAGRFEDRMVVAEDGRLKYHRGTGGPRLLTPLGGNRFAFHDSPADHLEFLAAGNIIKALAIIKPDRSVQGTYERTP